MFEHLLNRNLYEVAFENFFIELMKYSDPRFEGVRAYGKDGDDKSDGRIEAEGLHFQVYAPNPKKEDKLKKLLEKKINSTIDGISIWPELKKLIFVFNLDQIPAENLRLISECNDKNNFEVSKLYKYDLWKIFRKLSNEEKDDFIGCIKFAANDISSAKFVTTSDIKQVINAILKFKSSLSFHHSNELIAPNFDEKLEFNRLNKGIQNRLNHGYYSIAKLDDYLENEDGLISELTSFILTCYQECRNELRNEEDWQNKIIQRMTTKILKNDADETHLNALFIIFAKYFASCDILDPPEGAERI